MKALITGATGFIGGSIAAYLVKQGWEVNVLVRSKSYAKLDHTKPYAIYQADLGDCRPDSLNKALEDCEVVFHAASIRNRWGTPASAYQAVNVDGTCKLQEASIGRIRRFVYISSVGVFGHPGDLDIDETYPIVATDGELDYHSSKAKAEQMVFSRQGEIEVVVVRPTITYGPGDNDGMLTRLIELIANHKFVRVGSGSNYIHLTNIGDLLQGLVLVATQPAAVGETFILAGPEPIQVYQLVNMIEHFLGGRGSRLYIPEQVARIIGVGFEGLYRAAAALKIIAREVAPPLTRQMVTTYCANRSFSSKNALNLVGFRPSIGIEQGLLHTIEWLAATGRLKR